MEDNKNILDEVAAEKGVEVVEPELSPRSLKIRKIFIVLGVLLVYGGIVAVLFITKSIWALIGLVVYCLILTPLLRFLRKLLKVEDKKLKY